MAIIDTFSRFFSDIGLQPQVKQGALGDCWLIGAFACLADFPGHVPWMPWAMHGSG